ncbi:MULTISPECIES: helix-turn-helix domain-containing protein [Thioalkalivibrio]|jgi:ribosome-binding protein aMBF1 (putative translation factor)|uniref:XRE family transcriptional regulator n=1 Tax=Thioalkalivibrio versutus TaxID=106634 RepID=A0A0G3G0T3_9GAMM|nr:MULTISPECIES: helix-turn-helix transcriptional regulator [Thioalkalivibrio]AKJ94805.1 XRE family transcriptional regulator [Thioalkalivibrio versutus]OOC49676.1 transcriptional regulator [Thioalkalivibrio versutus]
MKTHEELKAELLEDSEVRREYEQLGPEFEFIEALLDARARAGLSQAEVARRMGTTQSVVARLEGGRSAPTWKTLCRYAEATGRRLRLHLEDRA